MPKRNCPFEDNLLPQLKVHVGKKQLDNGVSSDERMKDVYDKTLNLLKTGMKAFSQKLNTSVQLDSAYLSFTSQSLSLCQLKSVPNLKQMLLNNNLQLEVSNEIINDIKMDLCGCCRVVDQFMLNKCYYCDQVFCSSCLSVCSGCSELFCSNCSIPVYNCEEQIICLYCHR